jgi:orotate phosphoribosyltransferase
MIRDLASRLSRYKVDAVCGPLTGGAFVALLVANELSSEFYYSEQVAAIPSDDLLSVRYRLPAVLREKLQGRRVAIVNDVTSVGSAVRGTLADLEACQARVVAIGSLLVLGSTINSFALSKGVAIETLATADQNLWDPVACPLCKAGVPVVTPSYGASVR